MLRWFSISSRKNLSESLGKLQFPGRFLIARVIIHAYNNDVGFFLPSQWSSTNHSVLGSKEPALLCNH